MNQIPTKQQVPVGVENRISIPLQFNTLSTIDFGLVRPVHIMETISGDKLSISHSRFLRALPMKMPTLGQVDLLTQSFFVPFRLCWPLYQAIKDGRQSVRLGSILYSNPKNPVVTNHDRIADARQSVRTLILNALRAERSEEHTSELQSRI